MMPPKQATLGYVKSGQQTLGCMLPVDRQFAHSLMRICPIRKFFGRPTGSSPKPQQSKLAFQRPHTTKAAEEKNEEVDGVRKAEACEEADAVDQGMDGDQGFNIDSYPKAQKSAMDTERADPVVNGADKVKHLPANGEGESFNSYLQLSLSY